MIAYALCGSFCTVARSLAVLTALRNAGEELLPIESEILYETDTRFASAESVRRRLEEITGREVLHTVREAEPIGPVVKPELLVVAPCTGNTLAKIAHGITDTSVTMAVKSQLRSDRPVLLALASNDGLSGNLSNIATLLTRKNVYFVPVVQDDPKEKPHSLVADFSRIPHCIEALREGKQLRPLFLST